MKKDLLEEQMCLEAATAEIEEETQKIKNKKTGDGKSKGTGKNHTRKLELKVVS